MIMAEEEPAGVLERCLVYGTWLALLKEDEIETCAVADLLLREQRPELYELAWEAARGASADARLADAAELVLQWSLRTLEVWS